jgi:hypothetical protein
MCAHDAEKLAISVLEIYDQEFEGGWSGSFKPAHLEHSESLK